MCFEIEWCRKQCLPMHQILSEAATSFGVELQWCVPLLRKLRAGASWIHGKIPWLWSTCLRLAAYLCRRNRFLPAAAAKVPGISTLSVLIFKERKNFGVRPAKLSRSPKSASGQISLPSCSQLCFGCWLCPCAETQICKQTLCWGVRAWFAAVLFQITWAKTSVPALWLLFLSRKTCARIIFAVCVCVCAVGGTELGSLTDFYWVLISDGRLSVRVVDLW